MNLYNSCTGHPVSVLMAFTAVFVLGLLSIPELERENIPVSGIFTISVVSRLEGYPAGDMESLVTLPLEISLGCIEGIQDLESVSRRGRSEIRLSFLTSPSAQKEKDSLIFKVREAVDKVYPSLPDGMEKPLVMNDNSLSPRYCKYLSMG
ncbi:MAG: efflux RND transporter permease subunit [Spirochaetales bacterium]|nr:efflux RND transporter permease subunit [Spirochaetales bacterium]